MVTARHLQGEEAGRIHALEQLGRDALIDIHLSIIHAEPVQISEG